MQKSKKLLGKIHNFENIHIKLWLLKDLSWLMSWKLFGIFMILPTVGVAALIAWKSKEDKVEFFNNLAVLFWITANSFWMVTEFFEVEEQLKIFALIPFLAGISSTMVSYFLGKK